MWVDSRSWKGQKTISTKEHKGTQPYQRFTLVKIRLNRWLPELKENRVVLFLAIELVVTGFSRKQKTKNKKLIQVNKLYMCMASLSLKIPEAKINRIKVREKCSQSWRRVLTPLTPLSLWWNSYIKKVSKDRDSKQHCHLPPSNWYF